MRYLVLLRGSAGCGKSTWLEQSNLKQYAINADDVRLMFQSPITDIYGKSNISQKNDNKVWEFIRKLIEERMKRGELTIVDATHSRTSLIQDYKKLCEEYRYRCVVVEFPNDLETVLQRNAQRPALKQVPEDAVRNMVERIATQPTPNWCLKTTPEKFMDEYGSIKVFDFNDYDKVVHIGDIHGCFEPLKKYFDENPYSEKSFYIFLGDYVDRGIQNKEVLEFLFDMMNKKNVLLLEGNHEKWLRMYSEDKIDSIRSKEFTKYTMPQIESLDKKQVREFCRRLGQLALYKYGLLTVFACHGGYPVMPTPFTASEELIFGAGKYEDYLTVEETWNKNFGDSHTIQIHGHRNTDHTPIQFGNVYNLCDTVEFGGELRIMTLFFDNSSLAERFDYIKNNTFFVNELSAKHSLVIDENNILESLMHNKLIAVKKLTGNVVSLNFTRDAFFDKEWNELTVTARGLFVNTVTKEIVARSYEKFFNYEENDSMKLSELRRNMLFPAKAYLKYNGYLGIVGYDSETDDLFVATKSVNHGDMQKQFQALLAKNVNMETLKNFVKNENQSLVFEVIDPINDPHIIEYDKQEVVLLDCIDRTWKFNRTYDLYDIAKELGLTPKEETHYFKDYDEFYKFTEELEQEDFSFDGRHVEGFVVEDSNGLMVKFKTKYYKFWKFMRSLKEKVGAGHVVNTAWLTTANQNKVYAFIKEKGRDYCKEHSIIQIRNEYEKGDQMEKTYDETTGVTKTSHEFQLKCNDFCGIIDVSHDEWDGYAIMSYYELGFYAYQAPWMATMRENLQLIWNILRGKRYCLYQVIIPKERWEEFKKFIAET